MENLEEEKRYVRYRTEVGGPYFVMLKPKQAVDFYAEQRGKGNPCEIMPVGYIPSAADLRGDTGTNTASRDKMPGTGTKSAAPDTSSTDGKQPDGSGGFCGSCPGDSKKS